MVVAPKDPIPLKHLGKKEVLTKIDLMEDQFDKPMVFDESQIPTQVLPVATGQDHGAWGYGVGVYGAAQDYRREVATASLMAGMYGFACEEEMAATKEYLHRHGGYQLEQVRALAE